MSRQFQEKLLNFMESGHIKVDQMRKKYDFKIQGAKVFAACNEITRLSKPLQSRLSLTLKELYNRKSIIEGFICPLHDSDNHIPGCHHILRVC
jgi:hypothetical protein